MNNKEMLVMMGECWAMSLAVVVIGYTVLGLVGVMTGSHDIVTDSFTDCVRWVAGLVK